MRIGGDKGQHPRNAGDGAVVIPGAEEVVVRWGDGHRSRYRWRWLRDSCPCGDCRGDGSSQRLLDLRYLPSDPRPEVARIDRERLTMRWEGDGHQSDFPLAWLRAHCSCPSDLAIGDEACAKGAVPGRPVLADWGAVATDDTALAGWLETVVAQGWAGLRGVPPEPCAVLDVVARFGFVRETNYGRLFDVRTMVDPRNLAFTSRALGPHTDNPYRQMVPTLQLLHCLSSSSEGGESILVDGFAAAAVLRSERPGLYAQLATWSVPWRYADESTDLATEAPVLELGPGGQVVGVRFNERSRGPLRLEPDVVDEHLLALRRFAAILDRPELQVRITLSPGDLLLFDNRRMLHGRTEFSSAGDRHLQGCYADRDGLDSRLAVLHRRIHVDRSASPRRPPGSRYRAVTAPQGKIGKMGVMVGDE